MTDSEHHKEGAGPFIMGAVVCEFAGLICVLYYLLSGFGPATMGIGFFIGAPLLMLALVLYLIAVVRDLRRRQVL